MFFKETTLKGAYVITPEFREDHRGFFCRTYCEEAFKERGLHFKIVQTNLSYNKKKGTLRGLHYQESPHEEAKVVECRRGAILDVMLDLRPESPSYKEWCAIELSDENRKMLFLPEGFAHGFQTLKDNTEVAYLMSEFYRPAASKGIRWDDPAFSISWPIHNPILSDRDQSYHPFEERRS